MEYLKELYFIENLTKEQIAEFLHSCLDVIKSQKQLIKEYQEYAQIQSEIIIKLENGTH